MVYFESTKVHNSKPLSTVYDQFQSCALLKEVKEKVWVRYTNVILSSSLILMHTEELFDFHYYLFIKDVL